MPAGTSIPGVESGRRVTLSAVEAVRAKFADAILGHVSFRDEETLLVAPAGLIAICDYLKRDPAFLYDYLIDITASHWLDRDYEYEVAYLLCSLKNNSLLRLKVRAGG